MLTNSPASPGRGTVQKLKRSPENGTNITGVRTNIFHNETVVGDLVHTTNFPALAASLTFAEKILLAAVSAVLTVPLVVLCFTSLITLAMSKKNERLWEKFGTQDLGGNLVTRRKIVKQTNQFSRMPWETWESKSP